MLLALQTLGSFDFQGTFADPLWVEPNVTTEHRSHTHSLRRRSHPLLYKTRRSRHTMRCHRHRLQALRRRGSTCFMPCRPLRQDRQHAQEHAAPRYRRLGCVSPYLLRKMPTKERTDPWIRELTLTSLTTEFDHHLARPELIRSLLLALSDEVFGVRYAAVVVLGRVGEINPAATMPAVRKAMICLMTELDYTTSRCVRLTSMSCGNVQRRVAQSTTR